MKISKIKKSCADWKVKAKDRGKTVRNLKKTAKAKNKRAVKKTSNGDGDDIHSLNEDKLALWQGENLRIIIKQLY